MGMKNKTQMIEISPNSQSLSAEKVDAPSGNQEYLVGAWSPNTNIDENDLANIVELCQDQWEMTHDDESFVKSGEVIESVSVESVSESSAGCSICGFRFEPIQYGVMQITIRITAVAPPARMIFHA